VTPRDATAAWLDDASTPGGPLDAYGPNSTRELYYASFERQLVFDEVVDEYLARTSDVGTERRAAVVMSGLPAAGKTHLRVRAAVDGSVGIDERFRVIDADEIKELLLLRGQDDGIFDSFLAWRLPDRRPLMLRELAGLVHAESVAIADDVRKICVARGEDILIDGTLGWRKHAQVVLRDLEDHRYQSLVILGAESRVDECVERSRARWWDVRDAQVDPLGGRYVPRGVIEALYATGAHHSMCWDNAEEMFRAAGHGGFRDVVLRQSEGGETLESRHHREA
jgi:hypothetical protein